MLHHKFSYFLLLSIILHIGMVVFLFFPQQPIQQQHQQEIIVDIIPSSRNTFLRPPTLLSAKFVIPSLKDLRASFMKNKRYFSFQQKNGNLATKDKDDLYVTPSWTPYSGPTHPSGIPNPYSRELLLTETKVLDVFDRLAAWINQYLEYPLILIENGVYGIATLDLYFDGEGNIDEARSKFFGDNRSVRGLLVRASRKGLVKWFLSDASRLRKDQFKDQHFQVEFTISYALSSAFEVIKTNLYSYTFRRRYYKHECAEPTGVNLTCIAMKAYGAIQRNLSARYKAKFQALQDQLEHFDNLGLSGISAMIRG